MLICQVLSRGGRASVSFIVGMVLGNAVWLVVAMLGLAALSSPTDRPFALSLEVMEIESRFAEKRFNTLHAHLAGKDDGHG